MYKKIILLCILVLLVNTSVYLISMVFPKMNISNVRPYQLSFNMFVLFFVLLPSSSQRSLF